MRAVDTIRAKVREWVGPSKRDLLIKLAAAENRSKFGRNAAQASGVEMSWGEFQTEHNKALQGAGKFAEFDKMEADPHVKAVLLGQSLPLLTAEWEFKPASDKPRDKEIADLCTANILRQPTDQFGREYWCRSSWTQRLGEHLQMLRDGFSLSVPTYRRVGTKQVLDRLQWIEPSTIDGTKPWDMTETDDIVGVNRKLRTPNDSFLFDEFLEAKRMRLFVWDLRGARFEGRSFMRSMYGAFVRKEFILRQAAIWAQKIGAPIPVGHYPPHFTADDITRFNGLVRSGRGSSPAEAYGSFPKDSEGVKAELEYWGANTGEVDRMRGLIDGENKEIHHGGGSSGDMLGETESGSRSLGESKGRKDIKITQAIGILIAEQFNHGVANLMGVTEDVVNRSYADVQDYPELVCTKVDPFENFGETIEAWNAGIIPKTADARRQITEGVLGLNLPDEDYEIEEVVPPPLGVAPPPPGVPGPPPSADPEEPVAAVALSSHETIEAFRARVATLLEPQGAAPSGAGFRAPNRLEASVLNLAAIRESFRIGERDFRATAAKGHRAMINDLMSRLRAGLITQETVERERRSAYRGHGTLTKQFVTVARRVGREGMGHVKAEIAVQVTF